MDEILRELLLAKRTVIDETGFEKYITKHFISFVKNVQKMKKQPKQGEK